MTDRPDRQDGDGLRKPLERLLAAFKGLMPFPLVIQAVAEGLVRDAETALATSPTRDSAEGARVKCPRCGSDNVDVERARKPFTDSLACGACNYVGPISNPNYPAPPKPAPDAMREALATKIEKAWRWEHRTSVGHFVESLATDEQAAIVAALRSAPVSPADGADRAILIKMREPTPAMLRAATGESPKAIWQAMINEALK